MKSLREIEQVGWVFFLITTVVLTPVCLYAMYHFTFGNVTNTATRVLGGIIMAAFVSGLISTAVNEVLGRLAEKRQRARRKEEKKKKR